MQWNVSWTNHAGFSQNAGPTSHFFPSHMDPWYLKKLSHKAKYYLKFQYFRGIICLSKWGEKLYVMTCSTREAIYSFKEKKKKKGVQPYPRWLVSQSRKCACREHLAWAEHLQRWSTPRPCPPLLLPSAESALMKEKARWLKGKAGPTAANLHRSDVFGEDFS